jgi:hypothetical protein
VAGHRGLEETTVKRWLVRGLAALSIASVPLWSLARAEYPDRAIKVICAYAAGGGGDLMVRWYANALKDVTGKPVLVENKVGANGHVGDQAAMDARPDGYTMIITGASAYVGNPLLMKGIDYDPMTALAPITTLNELGLILVVNPKLPIHSVADLTAFIKSKNGKALYGVQTSSALVATNLYLQKIGAEATRELQKRGRCRLGYRGGADRLLFPGRHLGDGSSRAGAGADAGIDAGEARLGRARASDHAGSGRTRFRLFGRLGRMVSEGNAGADHRADARLADRDRRATRDPQVPVRRGRGTAPIGVAGRDGRGD